MLLQMTRDAHASPSRNLGSRVTAWTARQKCRGQGTDLTPVIVFRKGPAICRTRPSPDPEHLFFIYHRRKRDNSNNRLNHQPPLSFTGQHPVSSSHSGKACLKQKRPVDESRWAQASSTAEIRHIRHPQYRTYGAGGTLQKQGFFSFLFFSLYPSSSSIHPSSPLVFPRLASHPLLLYVRALRVLSHDAQLRERGRKVSCVAPCIRSKLGYKEYCIKTYTPVHAQGR
ncbi:hypothetical protein L249_4768 [Ophiocordyceps polyrhachis-furcata BCC 54312]|uniref:Uncharacterized protein n=1 Tax=Ophiocordyceps polyrhachis-furcata BCC 54312 TaxID=1330021 RepID=A0A367L2Q4_9HYPO|nr:hypothetical protein L249_4768 [Ophiocordyceps polyrhachis-furcata BCC 54312]